MPAPASDTSAWRRAHVYRAALDLVGDCAEARTTEEFCGIVLPGLHRVLGCDEAALGVVGLERFRVLRTASFPTQMREIPGAARLWVRQPQDHPWLVHLAATRDPRAARLSDVVPRATLVRSRYWHEFYVPRGLRSAELATLSLSGRRAVGISLGRQVGDFSVAENELVEQLRRPLGRLWERLEERERAHRSRLVPVPRLTPVPADGTEGLTAAQRSVVRLVAEGLSNHAVADALGVSDKAVEQHLTQVYRRLGVSSRTQLVLRTVASAAPPAERP